MKKLFLFLFIPIICFGQKSNDSSALKLCVAIQSNNFTTNAEAEDAVNKILSVIGTSQKPVLQSCSNINNAVAAVYKGQRYILYDTDFMNSLTEGTNKYWSNMFILAHEVGHHINGHSLDIILYANDVIDPKSLEEKRRQELEADEFAGFVLAKLGASLSQTSDVISNLPRIFNENTSTHPTKEKRIASIKKGHKNGSYKVNKKITTSTKPNRIEKTKIKKSASWFSEYVREKKLAPYWVEDYKKSESFDPFKVKSIYKNFPIMGKISSSYGISMQDPTKKIKLEIIQSKYKYKDHVQLRSELAKKYLPFKGIKIFIDGMQGVPRFVNSWWKKRVEKDIEQRGLSSMPKDIEELTQINGQIKIAIDDEFSQDFVIYFGMYTNNLYGREVIEIDWYDQIPSVSNEENMIKFLNFLEALKNGKKLYIKLNQYRQDLSDYNQNFTDWYFDGSINSHTYEFDLSGSSNALQF